MGLTDWIRNKLVGTKTVGMLIGDNSTLYNTRKLQGMDIFDSAARPFAKELSKLIPQHVRETNKDGNKVNVVNPEPYIEMLLIEPNPYMSMQVMLERIGWDLKQNRNAFVVISRDEYGYASELYPITSFSTKTEFINNVMHYKFMLQGGKQIVIPHMDIIHIRDDFRKNEVFGEHPSASLEGLAEIIQSSDTSRINASKQSTIMRWLLKFNVAQMHDEDVYKAVNKFKKDYLNLENEGGVIASDGSYEVKELENKQYVPTTSQIDEATKRVHRAFSINEKIITASANEEEMEAYFESAIVSFAMQLSAEFTRKLFSRKERGHGNKIVFDVKTLQFASMKTMIELFGAIDRGLMAPNEWRKPLNLPPIADGDQFIRRLDTAVIDNAKGGDNNATN